MTICHNDATFLSPSYRQTHNKLMHCDTASNYDMLMGTQCTICLSSDHSERAPQRPPLSFSFQFFSSPLPPLLRLSSLGREEKLGSSQRADFTPFVLVSSSFCLCHPLRLSKAPRQLPSLYLLSLSFFHFLPLDPDSSYEK